MKEYVKQVKAIQFNGDMATLTDFIGTDSTFILEGDKYTLTTPTKKWNVVQGDYVVKGYKDEISVYKAPRFEAEFKEVVVPTKEAFIPKVHNQAGITPSISKAKEEAQKESGKGIASEDNKKSKEE